MDTNTIMLIALAIIVVLSALAIWLSNRGSGVEEPLHEHETDSIDSDDAVVEHDTVTTASKQKVVDTKTVPSAKVTDSKATSDVKAVGNKASLDDKSDVRIVDNTKKAPVTVAKPPVDSKDNVNQVRDAKNPPKNR